MQSSILRVRAPISRLACRAPSSSIRAMGTYATFKTPVINNEPNVSFMLELDDFELGLIMNYSETLHSRFPRPQGTGGCAGQLQEERPIERASGCRRQGGRNLFFEFQEINLLILHLTAQGL